MLKRAVIAALLVMLLLPAGQVWGADALSEIEVTFSPLHYIVDGMEYAPPRDAKDAQKQQGFLYNGSTYVPIRFVSNILYKTVDWDPQLNKVMINDPNPSVNEELEKRRVEDSNIKPVDTSKLKKTKISVAFKKIAYEVNGVAVDPPTDKQPGFIFKGSTYVPLRYVYNALGYEPDWDPVTRSITAVSNEEQAAQKEHLTIYTTTEDAIWVEINKAGGLFTAIAKPEADRKALKEKGLGLLEDGLSQIGKVLDSWRADLEVAGKPTTIVDEFKEFYNKKADYYRGLAEQLYKG